MHFRRKTYLFLFYFILFFHHQFKCLPYNMNRPTENMTWKNFQLFWIVGEKLVKVKSESLKNYWKFLEQGGDYFIKSVENF